MKSRGVWKYLAAFMAIMLAGVLFAVPVVAASSGPNYADNSGQVSYNSYDRSWSDVDYARIDGGLYAYVNLEDTGSNHDIYSDRLQCWDYDFNLPSGAVITGIEVAIEHYAETDNDITDVEVMLMKDGVRVGSNKANPSHWDNNLETFTYGGDGDWWGTTWSEADVEDHDFGVSLAIVNDDPSDWIWARVDYMSIKVYYSTGTAPAVTTHPSDQPITYGDVATFSAAASGSPAPTVKWQVDTGSGWTDIANGGVYSDATTGTLTLTKAPVSYSGYLYRAVFTNGIAPDANSNSALLTVAQKPITVTAVYDSKIYDGTTASAGVPTITGGLVAGDTAGFSQVFDGSDAGSWWMIVSGTVNDGAGGANYDVDFEDYWYGYISPKPITVTAINQTKMYGTIFDPPLTFNVSPALIAGDGFSGSLVRVPGEWVGTYPITQGTLTAGSNYDITYVAGNFTIYTQSAGQTQIPAGVATLLPPVTTTTPPAPPTVPATTTTTPPGTPGTTVINMTNPGSAPTTGPVPPQQYVTLPGGTSLPPTSPPSGGGGDNMPALYGIGGGSLIALGLILFLGLRRRKEDR